MTFVILLDDLVGYNVPLLVLLGLFMAFYLICHDDTQLQYILLPQTIGEILMFYAGV